VLKKKPTAKKKESHSNGSETKKGRGSAMIEGAKHAKAERPAPWSSKSRKKPDGDKWKTKLKRRKGG